ncbi:MAG TPA: FtsQ-type POTRA domain-containing protein [Actinomycetota bacterium]|nr:FtsQ-type POTRA domain-containing protein [Actinomycetota bacterium]
MAVWNSSWLKFRSVQVAGNRHTPAAEIIGVAALVPGTRLTDISSSAVARRVEALPWVATASVSHVLPSRIRIVVTERRPAVVVIGPVRAYLVDRTGRVLSAGNTGYPAVNQLDIGAPLPGTTVTSTAFAPAVAVLGALPQDLRSRLASIQAPAADLISILLTDHTRIVYGDAHALADKNADVTALLATGQSFASIDVQAPAHPAAVPH